MDNVELNTEIIRIHAISPNKVLDLTFNYCMRQFAQISFVFLVSRRFFGFF